MFALVAFMRGIVAGQARVANERASFKSAVWTSDQPSVIILVCVMAESSVVLEDITATEPRGNRSAVRECLIPVTISSGAGEGIVITGRRRPPGEGRGADVGAGRPPARLRCRCLEQRNTRGTLLLPAPPEPR